MVINLPGQIPGQPYTVNLYNSLGETVLPDVPMIENTEIPGDYSVDVDVPTEATPRTNIDEDKATTAPKTKEIPIVAEVLLSDTHVATGSNAINSSYIPLTSIPKKEIISSEEHIQCPYCFSKTDVPVNAEEYVWSDDPTFVIGKSIMKQYQGILQIKPSHIVELQNNRKILEKELGIEPLTEFTEINNNNFYQILTKCIIELRTSTEGILDTVGMTKEEYFNYDENEDLKGIGQLDWTDSLTENNIQMKALHIEDLRHYIRSAMLEMEQWNIWEDGGSDLYGVEDNKLGYHAKRNYYVYRSWAGVGDWYNYPEVYSPPGYPTTYYAFQPAWTGDIGNMAWYGSCTYPEVEKYVNTGYYELQTISCGPLQTGTVASLTGIPHKKLAYSIISKGKIKNGKLLLECENETGGPISDVVFSVNNYCTGNDAYIGSVSGAATALNVNFNATGQFNKYPIITENKIFTMDLGITSEIASGSITHPDASYTSYGYNQVEIRIKFTNQPEDKLSKCDNPDCDFKAYKFNVRDNIDYDYILKGYPCPICTSWTRPGEEEPRRSMIILESPLDREGYCTYRLLAYSNLEVSPTYGNYSWTYNESSKKYSVSMIDVIHLDNLSSYVRNIDLYNRIILPAKEELGIDWKYLQEMYIYGACNGVYSPPSISGYIGPYPATGGGQGGALALEVDNLGLEKIETEE